MRALPAASDVLRAAHARLAGWSGDRLAAALGDAEVALEHGDAEAAFAELVGGLEGADGRSACTAAGALLVLVADRREDVPLFWRAAVVVLDGDRQSRRGTQRRASDPLDRLIDGVLSRSPDATASAVFTHVARLGCARLHPIVDASDDEVVYDTGRQIRCVTRRAFEVRVSRARARITVPAPVSPPVHPAHNTDREARDVPIPHL